VVRSWRERRGPNAAGEMKARRFGPRGRGALAIEKDAATRGGDSALWQNRRRDCKIDQTSREP
jgi:hypothetical protein